MKTFCAACDQPITRGARFLLFGSEVIHKACVGKETVLWRAKRKLAEANEEIKRADRIRENMERLLKSANEQLRDVTSERDGLRCRMNSERSRQMYQDATTLDALELLRAQVATLTAANARLLEEKAGETLRADLAEGSAAAAREERLGVRSTPAQQADVTDDTAVRFSLLELDLE